VRAGAGTPINVARCLWPFPRSFKPPFPRSFKLPFKLERRRFARPLTGAAYRPFMSHPPTHPPTMGTDMHAHVGGSPGGHLRGVVHNSVKTTPTALRRALVKRWRWSSLSSRSRKSGRLEDLLGLTWGPRPQVRHQRYLRYAHDAAATAIRMQRRMVRGVLSTTSRTTLATSPIQEPNSGSRPRPSRPRPPLSRGRITVIVASPDMLYSRLVTVNMVKGPTGNPISIGARPPPRNTATSCRPGRRGFRTFHFMVTGNTPCTQWIRAAF
jgi:hypothetical protein